jgi:endonuclease/exonuclease/phosphatase family metal-dependent hydrolase
MCKWQVSALLRLTSKIGSFWRVGCCAVRGTKTALAVLAMLASVLAWGSAPARADDKVGHLGPHEVRVLTQNMFIGAPLGPIVQATSIPAFLAAINALPGIIQATKPAERAAAMAAEIATQRPDFVALHEVWKLTVGGVVVEDLLQYVLDALKALGQPYDLVHDAVNDTVAVVNEEDLDLTQLPPLPPPFPARIDFHLTDRDAILMRTDADIEIMPGGVQPILFEKTIDSPFPPPFNFKIRSGYVSVDATVRGIPLRFVSVHLVPNALTILTHTDELLKLATDNNPTMLPLVFGGDFNTRAENPNDDSYQIYQKLIDAGLTDAWNPHIHRPGLGLTCCQAPSLTKPSNLTARVDLILFSGAFAVEDINLIGNKEIDRTPSGLWPSDHAGLVATLATPLCQIEGRCGR